MIHEHDELYYTRNEVAEKYYTKEEVDELLQVVLYQMIDDGIIMMAHDHDDIYYTQAEMDILLCELDTPTQVFVDAVDIEALKEYL